MSLRVKLALALVLLTTAATLAIGTWSYLGTSNRLYAEIDRSLQEGVANADHGGPDPDHDNPAYSPRAGDEQVLVQVVGANGQVSLASAGVGLPVEEADVAIAASDEPPGTRTSIRRDVTIDGHPYRMQTTALGNSQGALQSARSLSETLRVLTSLRDFIIEAALVVIAAAAIAGWLIATQVTRRLVRLTGAAEEVASTGRLDVQVPIKGRDEAGRLGSAFNRMLTALGESRDSQQRLVQDAGHELRTPLTSLRTNVSVLRRHGDLPPETRARVLDDLDLETRELTTLVNELVELATDQRADEPREVVDLVALVERVTDRARRRSGRTIVLHLADGSLGATLGATPGDPSTSDLSTGEITVTGRPLALERAVSNLVDNATKFDATGGPIDATVTVTGGGARITVCDRGPGIAPADLPHVFDRFFRAVDARSRPGSGLGLSIVDDVARDHGGQPFATNRDGGGACVGFEVPAGQTESSRS